MSNNSDKIAKNPAPALLTGGTGFVGSALLTTLVARERPVRLLVRGNPLASTAPPHPLVEFVRGDLLDPKSLALAVRDVGTVFHCAGFIGDGNESAQDPFRVNGEGTRNLLEAAAAHPPHRFIHFSSIAVYGGEDLDGVDEDTPLENCGPYSTSKIEGENHVREFGNRAGIDTVILRPCQVYGPGDRQFLPRVKAMLSQPDLLLLGRGRTIVDFVHVSDLVEAALLAESSSSTEPGRAYNVTDGSRNSLTEFLRLVEKNSPNRHRIHPVSAKWTPAYTRLANWVRRLRHGSGTPPYVVLRLEDFTKHRHFDISRARRELGYLPKTDLAEGLSRL